LCVWSSNLAQVAKVRHYLNLDTSSCVAFALYNGSINSITFRRYSASVIRRLR